MSRHKDPLDLLLDAIFDRLFDAEGTGRFGEGLTAGELKRLSLFMGEGRVLRNAYVPKESGGTSEIDVLFITSRGMFVIESKNYSGWIFGNEADRYWTQCLEGGQKNRFYNPILQNRGHIKWLGRYLGGDVPLYSIIVFSRRCELKKITVTSADVVVIKRGDLGQTVRRIWNAAEGAEPVDVDSMYRQLEPLTHADAKTRAAHVDEAKAAAARSTRRRSAEKKNASEDVGRPTCNAAEPAPPKRAVIGKEKPGGQTLTSQDTASKPKDTHLESPASITGHAVPSAANDVATVFDAAVAGNDPAPEALSAPEPPLCPRCGKPLVVRVAKRGAHVGNQFYGCSGYPSYRYTHSL